KRGEHRQADRHGDRHTQEDEGDEAREKKQGHGSTRVLDVADMMMFRLRMPSKGMDEVAEEMQGDEPAGDKEGDTQPIALDADHLDIAHLTLDQFWCLTQDNEQ